MSVILDSIEPSHIKDLFHEFYPEGCVERLDSADLACTEYNVALERKTAPDFVGSVMGDCNGDGRLWHQARRMRDTYASSYIILIGGYDDLPDMDKQRFTKAMWEGAIISLMARYNMKFLKVNTNREFFQISKRIFSKSDGIDKHTMNIKRATNEKEAVLIGALYQVPGIGLEYSKRIIDVLGVGSIIDLCTVSKEDLKSVDGIGERKATAIKEYYFERGMGMIDIKLIENDGTYKGVPFEACEYEELRQIMMDFYLNMSNAFYNVMQTFNKSFKPLIESMAVFKSQMVINNE